MRSKSISVMVEGALMVALSFGLSFIKVFHLPQGGSVTLGGMVPLLVFAFRHGVGPGLMAGTAYGLLDLVVNPYVVHPAQLILDYPLAYGLLGLAGLFRKNIVAGSFLGILGRFVAHVLSGVIFFAQYAEGNVWVYSATYNGSYLLPEFVISVVLIMVLQRTAIMRKV
ncbi:MAG: energy-coupled thiamine transporter ThiT [Bacillota bacterium]